MTRILEPAWNFDASYGVLRMPSGAASGQHLHPAALAGHIGGAVVLLQALFNGRRFGVDPTTVMVSEAARRPPCGG